MINKLTYRHLLVILPFVFIILACSKQNLPVNNEIEDKTLKSEIVKDKFALELNDFSVSSTELESTLLGYAFEDSITLDSSIDDYIYKVQLFEEAKSKGFDKDPMIQDEIETYKRLLAQETLRDSLLLEQMIQESYGHLQYELNASHLFISLPSNSLPKDTLFVYNELLRIRNEALKTGQFDSLVNLYSQDRRTNEIGGSLGWFSGLQMVYPIEKAAYGLNEGDISFPVRSEQGYHLIKLNGRRVSRGSVQVRHLLKTMPSPPDSLNLLTVYKEIDSLRVIVKADPSIFEELIQNNSDDFNTRDNGGLLPYISTGSRVEKVFEDAAFQLDSGEVSDIVKSSIGFHLIQVVDKKPIDTFEESYEYIKQKVLTDSRGSYLEKTSLDKLKEAISFERLLNVPSDISQLFDKSLLRSEWQYSTQEKAQVLFRYNGGTVTLASFLKYVEDRQQYDPVDGSTSVDMAVLHYFSHFEKETLKELGVDYALRTSRSLKNQLSLIEKDLVCTKFYNSSVLEKAVADTIGQRRWYEQNLELFKKPERAYATVVEFANELAADSLNKIFIQDAPYRLKRGLKPLYFSKNFYFLSDEDKRRLTGLFAIMQKNPNYIVEIGGHRDVAEEGNVSSSRVNEVVSYLRELGLEITRIKESDYGQTRLSDRFDWTKNQRISIQFFSTDILDVIPSLKQLNEDILKIQRKWFSIEEAAYLWDRVGDSFVRSTPDGYAFIHVKRIDEPGFYSLREVRGRVINEYQKELEKQLRAKLEMKFPVKLNQDEINRLKKSLLKKI